MIWVLNWSQKKSRWSKSCHRQNKPERLPPLSHNKLLIPGMFKERIYLFVCLPACYRFHLFALALYVNWARFTDEKVSRRFHSPGWATNICTCLYLVVRDRIVLNKAKERYHLSWFYHFFIILVLLFFLLLGNCGQTI